MLLSTAISIHTNVWHCHAPRRSLNCAHAHARDAHARCWVRCHLAPKRRGAWFSPHSPPLARLPKPCLCSRKLQRPATPPPAHLTPETCRTSQQQSQPLPPLCNACCCAQCWPTSAVYVYVHMHAEAGTHPQTACVAPSGIIAAHVCHGDKCRSQAPIFPWPQACNNMQACMRPAKDHCTNCRYKPPRCDIAVATQLNRQLAVQSTTNAAKVE